MLGYLLELSIKFGNLDSLFGLKSGEFVPIFPMINPLYRWKSYIFKPKFGQTSPAKKSLFTTVVFEELISISVCFFFFLVFKFWRFLENKHIPNFFVEKWQNFFPPKKNIDQHTISKGVNK
jgi:disulfide bond formation protein DsbB